MQASAFILEKRPDENSNACASAGGQDAGIQPKNCLQSEAAQSSFTVNRDQANVNTSKVAFDVDAAMGLGMRFCCRSRVITDLARMKRGRHAQMLVRDIRRS